MVDTKLYIVVPCYNEEEVIEDSAKKLLDKMAELTERKIISAGSKILFVNDGSRDKTKDILIGMCRNESRFELINFVKNFGHQSAILAGINYAAEFADAIITIDADLQQDINAMEEFIKCYEKGNDVVYGVRNNRKTDGFFKRFTATLFYGLMHLLGCNVISNSADYRLLSKRAAKAIGEYPESNLFLRGLIPYMGFPSDIVYFDVKKREKGVSKYTFGKMCALAINGITSFSVRPIRLVTGMGIFICLCSVVMIIFSVVTYFKGGAVPGYTTNVVSTWLMGGLLMLSLGIIGEYIGKIYIESKRRPRYIIESIIGREEKEDA